MTITLDGEQLLTQLSGQQKIPVFAEADTKFFLKVVDAQLEFLKDANGKVTDVVLHQNGRETKASRISDTVQERKAITLQPEVLSAYAGSYQAGPLPIAIALKDGHLMMKAGPQPESELFAESETGFFLKTVDAQIDFVKDANGAVTGLVLHAGPQDIQGKRQ
jgi:hypothetical protein